MSGFLLNGVFGVNVRAFKGILKGSFKGSLRAPLRDP